jgi:hypothetical protein
MAPGHEKVAPFVKAICFLHVAPPVPSESKIVGNIQRGTDAKSAVRANAIPQRSDGGAKDSRATSSRHRPGISAESMKRAVFCLAFQQEFGIIIFSGTKWFPWRPGVPAFGPLVVSDRSRADRFLFKNNLPDPAAICQEPAPDRRQVLLDKNALAGDP